MSKVQSKVYNEMRQELAVRKSALLREKEELSRAAARIVDIDAEIAVIDSEAAEYDDAISKLPKEAGK